VFKSPDAASDALEALQNLPLFNKMPLSLQYAKTKSDVISKMDGEKSLREYYDLSFHRECREVITPERWTSDGL